jgi:hypothetical protein
MDEMITDLLEYTRTPLARGMEVFPRPEDFGVLCEQAVDEVRAAHRGVKFDYRSSGTSRQRSTAPGCIRC